MNDSYLTAERELTRPVDECLADGTLNPEAVGWSRHPLHRCNVTGNWGRKKRWDYWAVTSTECLLSVTYADLDYLGFIAVSLVDFETRRSFDHAMLVPFSPGFRQPETVGGGDISFRMPGLNLSFHEEPGATFIEADMKRPGIPAVHAQVRIEKPPSHETLNVIIPWSRERFQFTSKQNTLPATGKVTAGNRTYRFGPQNQSFGCLDYGRGIWPFKTIWNWASASGVEDGQVIGLQFGGKWTDGTGYTENGLCLNGRLHKIGEDLDIQYDRSDFMKPWSLTAPRSGRVNLKFEPFLEKPLKVPLGLAGVELHLCIGYFSGEILTDERESVRIRKLVGWAEEMQARW